MNFLKRLFSGEKPKQESTQLKNPDNTKLRFLLDTYGMNPSDDNYRAVVNEITSGNSFLLLPSANESNYSTGWKTAEIGTTLNLTSVFNLDGLHVLGAFSDEAALVNWTKKETQYTAIRTQDLVDFCKQNDIDRIVINSNQKNMFVLERNRENITTRTIQEETKVLVGTPSRPLSKYVLNKLTENFKKVDTIEEAYHYVQTMNNETSLVLGIKMSIVSDNSRAALHNALNNVLSTEKLEMPLDVMILETQDWLNTVRNIQGSLFYKR